MQQITEWLAGLSLGQYAQVFDENGTASVVYSSGIPACAGRPGLGKGQIFWVARYGELLF